MGKWIMTLTSYKEFSNKYDNEECTVSDVAKALADEIKSKLPFEEDSELLDIVEEFEEQAEDEETTEDQFNFVLNDLYDWADANHVWIECF